MNKWVYFGVWSLWVPGFHRRICTLIRIGAECHLDGMDYHLWSEFYFMMHIIICGRRLFSVRIWRAWKVKRMDPWRDLVHLNFNWDWLNDAERDKKPGNVKTVSLCVCERNNNIAIGHEHTAESWDSGTAWRISNETLHTSNSNERTREENGFYCFSSWVHLFRVCFIFRQAVNLRCWQ